MSAEVLRRAAQSMRERAEAATSSPWRDMPMGSEGSIVAAGGNTIRTARKPATCREFTDAQHIASWHPAVALAVADLLDDAAEALDLNTPTGEATLAVATAYLGESA